MSSWRHKREISNLTARPQRHDPRGANEGGSSTYLKYYLQRLCVIIHNEAWRCLANGNLAEWLRWKAEDPACERDGALQYSIVTADELYITAPEIQVLERENVRQREERGEKKRRRREGEQRDRGQTNIVIHSHSQLTPLEGRERQAF